MKKRHDQRNKPWKEFMAWCRRRKLNHLPAHPWTIAAYFRWCELRKPFYSIEEAHKAIARAHILKRGGRPYRHQTVRRTLRMIELRAKHRGLYGDLFREADFAADKDRVADFAADKDRVADFAAAENKGENKNPAPENRRSAGRRVQSMRSRPPLVSRRR